MSYRRVIPRDLFNEAKLLKCLGRVALLLHDREGFVTAPSNPDVRINVFFEHEDPEAGFPVDQDPGSGDLFAPGLDLLLATDGGRTSRIPLYSLHNSRLPWPLVFENEGDEWLVLDENGEFTPEFLECVLTTHQWMTKTDQEWGDRK